MAKHTGARAGARTLSEQLNEAVEALMADTPPPAVDAKLAPLLQIAADLRDLPNEEFKARLKAGLQDRPAQTIRVKSLPAGHHSATPCLVVRDAPHAIEFYRQAFGATELMRLEDPDGKILHAEIQIGDSPIALSDEFPEFGNSSPQSLGGSPVIIQVYFDDVDAVADRAVAAGAKVVFPIADQFYGDRAGRLADPFGHIWIVATHREDVAPDEMRKRADAWMAQAGHPTTPAETSSEDSFVVEPYLPVHGANRLLDFLKLAFAAEETSRHTRPDGTIAHAEVRIGDSVIGIGDSIELQPAPTALHLYVPDADAIYARALRAGATSMQEPADQHYGDREAGVKDPFGNHWYIGTHKAEAADKPRATAYIPEGLHSISSYLHPQGAPQLVDFLKRAFGAEEKFSARAPDGTIVHAKIRIGESIVEMGEAHGPYQPMPTVYHLYVTDTDSAYRRAVAAGAISLSEPADQPWGYRSAGVRDPGGNQWWINAPLKAQPPEDAAEKEGATMTSPATETSSHTVTPFLLVHDVRETVDFLKDAFGADLILLERGGDPPHDHAELRIGDTMVMMGEATTGFNPTAAAFYLNVADVDAAYERALRAGATSHQPPKDMPWGHRMAHVKDALGNSWFIAAHKKNVQ